MDTFDIILDSSGELIEKNGEFFSGENDNNLIYYNVISHKGHYRTAPLLGVGIDTYLLSNVLPTVIERDIKSNLANDIFPRSDVNARDFPTIIINKNLVISTNGND